jgi:hypothetical protein
MRKYTPWGAVQQATELAPGIIAYSTASHGGIWLSTARRQALGYANTWIAGGEWFEEDCDWAVPYLYFADDIRAHGKVDGHFERNLGFARDTIKHNHPEFAKRIGLI